MIRVGVVDDQELVRSGIRMLLEDEPDVAVVAEASDGDEVPALLAEHTDLDVLLLDLRMARTGG
ncbi:MAG: response regulator transcription factor, partial [Phycicoccus sp.]